MPLELSVLQKARPIEEKPFPHIVIENALPDELYQQLLETRPQVSGDGENKRLDIRAADAVRQNIPVIWKRFIQYHCSEDFYKQVNYLFGLNLKGQVGMRYRDRVPVRLDCQISINTPATEKARVCEAHYDNPETKFAGLFYMGEDDAGLELFDVREPEYYGKRRVANPGEPIKTIPFQHNTFIGILNTPKSIHAPEPRLTDKTRHFVNFCIDS